ncbi:DUF4402 domain-containing protein [Novosphingobium lentum]|uniref:DUF4402 domain-containing protein n=1 Tax=Novosphingobium lentum TaxID=145287 RepID=UPI0008361B29|nr:DUF4402 domain-containing protein [Novosphingobium lentum]
MRRAGALARQTTTRRRRTILAIAAVAAFGLSAVPAVAGSGNAVQVSGSAIAQVVAPVSMTNLGDMRFGSIARPTTSGTLRLSPTGGVTTTGGVTGNQAISQGTTGPLPGSFQIVAPSNRAFTIYGPTTFNISSGASTMPVTLLTGALQQQADNGTAMTYLLSVGGTLTVAGNQAVGAYSGTYTLTTILQ